MATVSPGRPSKMRQRILGGCRLVPSRRFRLPLLAYAHSNTTMDHAEEDPPQLPQDQQDEKFPTLKGKKRSRSGEDSFPGINVTRDGACAVVTFSDFDDHDYRLCIEGRAKLTCLEGEFSVMGYHLEKDMEVQLTSPSWSSLLTITGVTAKDNATKLRLESIRPPPKQSSFQIFSPTDPAARPTVIPDSWKKAVDSTIQDWAEPRQISLNTFDDDRVQRRRARMVVCGAKGVGKSTYVRYATNRLLRHHDKVAILDADVGQPELAPPGVLTLSVVSRPLLQPPYANVMTENDNNIDSTKVSSLFYGYITSKVDPTRYMECLQYLIQQYEQQVTEDGDETNIPLVVNLDGWVKGIGYQVLTALLTDTLKPSHVIQILGETKAKQFELDFLSDRPNQEDDDSVPTKLHVVDACTNVNNNYYGAYVTALTVTTSSMPPSALRELRLGAYFVPRNDIWDSLDLDAGKLQQGWMDDDCTLATHLAMERPYCVPFEAVNFFFVGADRQDVVSEAMLLEALNGTIVALCTSADQQQPHECIGLGLIRSIDKIKRLFYILTPVDPTDLPQVKALVGGDVEVPLQFYFRGVHAESFPYLDFSASNNNNKNGALGSEPMKSRNNITRKSTAN